ncbi:MAG: pyrroloquinoline quinone biosynthesis protein PqqB [Rhodobacteraceae bacterium]|nr:pyrroloquinoline quinone biosynthesis protein PqqB [Paracoccaceae bacterium]MBR28215.1 pyrroloquinoline quinone biosynthesis protein PqqB [Paracoccaceae bacterium]
MKVILLGAAAGGGLPQWNCGCANCEAARAGRLAPLTQSSLAVSADGEAWALINASPDVGAQLRAAPALHPTGPRRSPIRAVLLTNGDIDHVGGLLTLREKQPFDLRMTGEIAAVLAANPIFGALDPDLVPRLPVALDAPFELLPGLTATLFAAPGKVPLYLEGERVETALEGEQTVGVSLVSGASRAVILPGCARVTPALEARIEGADLLFFDGTLWEDDEMIRLGLGTKTGARMGHMSMSGPEGSIAALAGLSVGTRVFAHINNSNPALRPDGPERAALEAAGWILGQDGMEFET